MPTEISIICNKVSEEIIYIASKEARPDIHNSPMNTVLLHRWVKNLVLGRVIYFYAANRLIHEDGKFWDLDSSMSYSEVLNLLILATNFSEFHSKLFIFNRKKEKKLFIFIFIHL